MTAGRPYAVDRMIITPHFFDVPLNWSNPDDERSIRIFSCEVVASESSSKNLDELPALCWFEGGPGYDAPRPGERSGLLKELLSRYRVFLLDERGTGLSAAIDGWVLTDMPVESQTEYLTFFRADSIAKDAEFIRKELLGDDGSWSIAGQSFGGWCSLTYLSQDPQHLNEAILLGGFAPVLRGPREVYATLVERIAERNERYFTLFPDDASLVRTVVDHLADGGSMGRTGETVRPEQFLAMGYWFGFHRHGAAKVHGIVERAARDIESFNRLTEDAMEAFYDPLTVSRHPIYAALHEAIYCQGERSAWAGSNILDSHPKFARNAYPCPYFGGEIIAPWMFDTLPALRPLKEAAHRLADKDDWGPLYDVERLRANEVPTVGTIYYDDLYVDRAAAIETSDLLGNCSPWITNEYEHDGAYHESQKVFGRLYRMLDENKAGALIKPASSWKQDLRSGTGRQ